MARVDKNIVEKKNYENHSNVVSFHSAYMRVFSAKIEEPFNNPHAII